MLIGWLRKTGGVSKKTTYICILILLIPQGTIISLLMMQMTYLLFQTA